MRSSVARTPTSVGQTSAVPAGRWWLETSGAQTALTSTPDVVDTGGGGAVVEAPPEDTNIEWAGCQYDTDCATRLMATMARCHHSTVAETNA